MLFRYLASATSAESWPFLFVHFFCVDNVIFGRIAASTARTTNEVMIGCSVCDWCLCEAKRLEIGGQEDVCLRLQLSRSNGKVNKVNWVWAWVGFSFESRNLQSWKRRVCYSLVIMMTDDTESNGVESKEPEMAMKCGQVCEKYSCNRCPWDHQSDEELTTDTYRARDVSTKCRVCESIVFQLSKSRVGILKRELSMWDCGLSTLFCCG